MVFTENSKEMHVYDVIRRIRCNQFSDLLNVVGEFELNSVYSLKLKYVMELCWFRSSRESCWPT